MISGLVMVPVAGLEPARLAALDFESSTSTNSITPADCLVIITYISCFFNNNPLSFPMVDSILLN